MNQLPVQRASELSLDSASLTQWLVQGLWSDQAVGILGGEPKCCKSFLALDLAVSVASGTPCLRRFAVRRTGPVLLFPAEDSLAVVRQRLEGICSAADVDFQSLPVEVITAPTLRLDAPKDRERLSNTVQARQPRLLILDPLIRLHRVDENDASQIAGLLSYLRQLQRTFHARSWLSITPEKTPIPLGPAKPCVAQVNCTDGATLIFTCAGAAPS